MQLVRNRLKKIDVYAPGEADGYLGRVPSPRLLGYVYADVSPITEKAKSENGGVGAYRSAKISLNGTAGVSCGDYVDIDGSGPRYRITELSRSGSLLTATAEEL